MGHELPLLPPAQQLLRVSQVWRACAQQGAGTLQVSVLQHNTVPVMMLLLCILKASNAVPNWHKLLYLAPTARQ